jgi:hypothetical protein
MPHHATLSERLRGLAPKPKTRLGPEREWRREAEEAAARVYDAALSIDFGHVELLRSAELRQIGLDVPKRGARA